jgi:ATP-dependent helicase/nuclease subunit A
MVLADVLLLEEDDLALATILRSPLFGWDEQQLFDLAYGRKGSLRAALRAASDAPHCAEAEAALIRLGEFARREMPFAFYARVLGPERGRARVLSRLGPEAIDALGEFLNLALDYEKRETPSLQGFVSWLRASPTQIKRDMETSRNEVRVMTVHGAKGLEAPVVILADTVTKPAGPREPRLFSMPADDADDRIIWAGPKATDVPPVAAAREHARHAAEDEHRRLLYVAMTRAADRLIVCGAEGVRGPPPGCWYELVHDALVPVATEVPTAEGDGKVWRLHKAPDALEEPAASPPIQQAMVFLPAWLSQDAPVEESRATVNPSGAPDDEEAVAPRFGGETRNRALKRGTLVHRLMQSLPDIPSERRQAAARQFLERNAGEDFAAAETEALIGQIIAVLDDPRFAPLAAPGSLAEAPIVGRLVRAGRTLAVSGQVDRLAVTPSEVLIGDYKTNRPAPQRLEDVPRPYLGQLALYRAVLAELYPDRAIRCLLVWTDVPDFMEIPTATLDSALAAVTAA